MSISASIYDKTRNLVSIHGYDAQSAFNKACEIYKPSNHQHNDAKIDLEHDLSIKLNDCKAGENKIKTTVFTPQYAMEIIPTTSIEVNKEEIKVLLESLYCLKNSYGWQHSPEAIKIKNIIKRLHEKENLLNNHCDYCYGNKKECGCEV